MFAWGDRIQKFSDFLPQGLDITCGGFAEPRFEFGKELFDRVQIRRGRWKKRHDGSRREDRPSTPATL